MDAPTRAAAIEKADLVSEQLGYPAFILNDTALMDYYSDVVISQVSAQGLCRISEQVAVFDLGASFFS